MSDFRFGIDDYGLNYYPPEASNGDGGVDWDKVDNVEIENDIYVKERECDDVSTKHGLFVCSECGCKVEEEGVDFGGINYCPDCGKVVKR